MDMNFLTNDKHTVLVSYKHCMQEYTTKAHLPSRIYTDASSTNSEKVPEKLCQKITSHTASLIPFAILPFAQQTTKNFYGKLQCRSGNMHRCLRQKRCVMGVHENIHRNEFHSFGDCLLKKYVDIMTSFEVR